MERAKAIKYLERHQWLIKAQSEGLSHDDSLLQLPFRANCFNWVLGHVIVHRDIMLDLMHQSPVLSPEETAPYIIESEPLAAEGDAVGEAARIVAPQPKEIERFYPQHLG